MSGRNARGFEARVGRTKFMENMSSDGTWPLIGEMLLIDSPVVIAEDRGISGSSTLFTIPGNK
jgi:hypothetical protein